ncbi:restriction endonuclease subunit S [Clostridium perfringens]|uniref:restriction endonuclease subunit S n=1 Tax=Clostridium perfringens TaxID=1502 RepID=UPI0024BC0FE8|nr:restriction endonuclease subunit S [Clostridium perfringens]
MSRNVPKLRFKGFEDEWKEKKISDTLKIRHGKDQKLVANDLGKYPILGTGGIIGKSNEFLYDKESVLIGRKGTIDRPFYMNTPFWTVDTLFYSEIKKGFCAKFLYYSFQRINWKKYSEASGVPSLSASTIESIKYILPELNEQEKIANFLSKVDSIIEKQEKKVQYWNSYKKGMIQKIFSQKIRFKDDNGRDYPEWEENKLEDYIMEYTEKTVIDNQYPVLTSSRKGLMLQSEYFKDRQVTTDSNIGYFVIPRGYITFRSRSDDGIFVFNQNNIIDKGIISYFYPVFNFNESINKYYALIYMNNYLKKEIFKEVVGTSQLVLSMSKLKKLKIKFPCLDEQIKIANFLSNIDNIIEKESKKLEELKQWKKGLLQQMFV